MWVTVMVIAKSCRWHLPVIKTTQNAGIDYLDICKLIATGISYKTLWKWKIEYVAQT